MSAARRTAGPPVLDIYIFTRYRPDITILRGICGCFKYRCTLTVVPVEGKRKFVHASTVPTKRHERTVLDASADANKKHLMKLI